LVRVDELLPGSGRPVIAVVPRRQGAGGTVEHGVDLFERDAEELQGGDLLQTLEIRIAIEPVPGCGAARP